MALLPIKIQEFQPQGNGLLPWQVHRQDIADARPATGIAADDHGPALGLGEKAHIPQIALGATHGATRDPDLELGREAHAGQAFIQLGPKPQRIIHPELADAVARAGLDVVQTEGGGVADTET